VRNEEGAYLELFRSLLEFNQDCDGIWLVWLPFDSHCWRAISNSPEFQREVMVHIASEHSYSLITLPGSFEAYLSGFKGKTRYNLRRQVSRLRERGGQLSCVRITDAAEVPTFLSAASAINPRSRVYKGTGWRISADVEARHKLTQLADSGILRCYLLKCGGVFCAFAIGYQYRDTYYYHRIGFDDRLAPYSPGTVLLYLMIEDLCRHQPPRRINLGHGDTWETSPFGTDKLPGADVFLFRRSLKNHLWTAASAADQFAARLAKRLPRR
jgi:CelD/BcsL family acetyltransferase involved in cellulose biosynthesis